MTELITQYKEKLNYELIKDESSYGIVLRCYRPIKSKLIDKKQVWSIRFKTLDSAEAYAKKFIVEQLNIFKKRLILKEEKKIKNAEISSLIKIGDIFVSSWGYEQTNVDFFQVIDRTKSFVKVRRIYLESVEETSWCSDRVRPLKDNFISEKIERYKLNGNYFRTPTDSSARLVTDLSVTNRRSWGY